ncbi:MAG: alpha-mannosidase [Candidatus Aminicenantes bacterium]|nr:alpha-mannosidase [Candidatus Aminicenantes bacterium]
MSDKTLVLVCNAHLDPVWLWEWMEGAGEALSTYRTAAALCRDFEEFVFNHNEALLYQWIEEYEPELFAEIIELVKQKKWHIMGGWFLQPDCNLPAGESLVRNILAGRSYFKDKFGVFPSTAINFDPFGHSRGLVQILKKSGYTSYLFCRPDPGALKLPADDFIWVGYDGSEILAHRAPHHYNSAAGKAVDKVKKWIEERSAESTGLILWGIGNHGGGPSRKDLEDLRRFSKEVKGWSIRHGTPEDYFNAVKNTKPPRNRCDRDLNPWAIGCYTTMSRIKRTYRLLENRYFVTEKMSVQTYLAGLSGYPREELQEAMKDLLFCQFHDILPGSSIPEVEKNALQKMSHGLEILDRIRARTFFSLLSGQPTAREGEIPIFAYNPHPYPVRETFVCEFQPGEPIEDRKTVRLPDLTDKKGRSIPCQLEKESSNIDIDWRKRVVFRAGLKPGSMNRFSCRLKEVETVTKWECRPKQVFSFKNQTCRIAADPKTGRLEQYNVGGREYLAKKAFRVFVMADDADPWGMRPSAFRRIEGEFLPMNMEQAARFAGIGFPELKPVRVIEDGPVRTVIEALYAYGCSALCLRYFIPREGCELGVSLRFFWNEKDKMLKLSLPLAFPAEECRSQVAYGMEKYTQKARELVAQKWLVAVSEKEDQALSVINDGVYGFDFTKKELRLSLLRSAAYAAHPVGDFPLVPQDRFEPRIDQGEREFRFWIKAGGLAERMAAVDREAQVKNEHPLVLSCFPPGKGTGVPPVIVLEDETVRPAAVKMAEKDDRLIIRLFEPAGKARKIRINFPFLKLKHEVRLKAHEIVTLSVDIKSRRIRRVDLLENPEKGGRIS